VALKILGVKTSQELAMVLSASGLAQNLAAIRALASEGIQRGHMKLHARNIAAMAGAKGDLIDLVAKRIVEENDININRAREIIESLLHKTK
jgi:hydroxymethylglutaryl-CoA reductase